MKKIFLLFIILILLCCNKKELEKKSYIKTEKENIFKINYNTIVEKENIEKKIVISSIENINTFNPYRANSKIESFLKNALYLTIFYINPDDGSIEKNIIDFYKIENSTEIKFKLKKDIIVNKRILTSDDVIASLSLLNTYLLKTHYYKEFFINNQILKLEKIDDFEFKIVLDKPNSNILYVLASFPILTKEDINSIKDFSDFIVKWKSIDSIPVSTGMYKIKSLNENSITLISNNDYFKKGKPFTKEIEIKFYSSLNEMILAFINNEIDILEITNEEDFKNLYNYFITNKNKKVKFIDTNESFNKIFILWKDSTKKELKKEINNLMYAKLNNKYNISSNIFDSNKKNFRIEKIEEFKQKYASKIKLKILTYNDIKEISSDVENVLKNEFIDTTMDSVMFYKYIENVFIKQKEFDLTFVSYEFNNSLFSYYNFFFDDIYGFNKFYQEQTIIQKFDYLFKEYNTKKHKKELAEIFDLLENNNELDFVFHFKKYYLINSKIYNLKINSMYEKNFNLMTLENILKIKEDDSITAE